MANRKSLLRWILLIAAGAMLLTMGCVEKPEKPDSITLGNFPKLFDMDAG